MKPLGACTELLRAPVAALALAALAAFLLGVHWSSSAVSYRIAFSSPSSISSSQAAVTISPNANRSFDLSSLLAPSPASPPPPIRSSLPPPLLLPPPPPPPLPLPPPPPPPPKRLESFGIVDENGVLADDFEVGDVDGSWDIPSSQEGTGELVGDAKREKKEIKWAGARFRRFGMCPESMQEYVPCMDNEEEIGRLASIQRGERFERHCPADGKRLNCLVPAPKRYRRPIPWPMSRDEVYSNNVPLTGLVGDKEGHKWIERVKNKFRFPGGVTEFTHSTDQYLDQISKMVPDIAFGYHTRVALDVGCGVASFGAFLLKQNVLTMSIAPKDEYGNQIQFALERGVPAMIASFATRRLLYSSQAFDLIHCSKCQINWTDDNGILLLEVDRILRGGGYFVWAAEPVYKHEPRQNETWEAMEDLADRICWKLIKKEGNIAIWQKPPNKSSYVTRQSDIQPSFCDEEDDPNDVWYVRLKPCISRLPENGSGSSIPAWPYRLYIPPQRLAYIATNELFKAESEYWNQNFESYVRSFRWKKMAFRNIMDMRAGYGGFASALIYRRHDSWVMNVVPVSGPNTLPVIYDRGLIGVNHDWCEPFDTYPRTYDLLHALDLFSIEYKRCNITSILLEMDRILRPGGYAYIRDSTLIINELQQITKAMRWRPKIHNTQEGRYASRKILICQKR